MADRRCEADRVLDKVVDRLAQEVIQPMPHGYDPGRGETSEPAQAPHAPELSTMPQVVIVTATPHRAAYEHHSLLSSATF